MNPEVRNSSIVLDDLWLKASVAGSLWASFEIIVGSFLHNLHVPFTGSILTSFAVLLMISFFQIWPEKGLIWRTGLICALMKSISPSSVILGPMIGIFTEALIAELIIRLIGRNIAAYLLAGSLTLLSSLIHKIINLIILYGFDFINIYVNIYNYASKLLGSTGSTPMNLLYLLASIYILTGSLCAFAGYLIGRRAFKTQSKSDPHTYHFNSSDSYAVSKSYNIILLIFHALYIPFALFIFLYMDKTILKLLLTTVYLAFCLSYYRNIARKLLKPLFWIQLIMILLLAILFLDTSYPGHSSYIRGLKGGIDMVLRSVLIITAFSAISIELLNPKIKLFLVRYGFKKLYASLQLSFSALPVILENSSNAKEWLKNPVNSLIGLLNDANSWLNNFKINSNL